MFSSISVSALKSKSRPMIAMRAARRSRLDRLDQAGEIGLMEIADEFAQLVAVAALDRRQDDGNERRLQIAVVVVRLVSQKVVGVGHAMIRPQPRRRLSASYGRPDGMAIAQRRGDRLGREGEAQCTSWQRRCPVVLDGVEVMVRPRGLVPPPVSRLAPQASASTKSAMAAPADTDDRGRKRRPV